MLNCLHRGQKKKFRKKDDTFFHFLQLGLSMKEALAGGGALRQGVGLGSHRQAVEGTLRPPQGPVSPTPAGRKAGKSEGWWGAIDQDLSFPSLRDHASSPFLWPVLRSEMTLSSLRFIFRQNKRGGG